MSRSATEVMQSIIFSAILDAVEALKAASRGLPNQMVRDLQAIHPNVTFADLPKELQSAIVESTRTAFTQLLRDGYAVGPKSEQQRSRPLDRVPERERRAGPADRRGPPRGPRRPSGDRPDRAPRGPGSGPGAPSRPRKPKGKPRLS